MLQDNAASNLKDSTILLLEDEPLILMGLQDELASFGCIKVHSTTTTAGALSIINREEVDLSILDLHLARGQTSFDIATLLHDRHVPLVFASGSRGDERPTELLDVPLVDKPFVTGALEAALTAALKSRRLRPTAGRINPVPLCNNRRKTAAGGLLTRRTKQ